MKFVGWDRLSNLLIRLKPLARVFLLFYVLLFGATHTRAHEDRILPISANGHLDSVPDEYGPASILVRHPADTGHRSDLPQVTVQLNEREVRLPACLARLFQLPAGETMRVHGSWYHDLKQLPPYLVINLPRETVRPGWFSGYTLMFDMRNAHILKVEEHILSADHNSRQSKEALHAICSPSEVAAIRGVP
jgi:hypothetical protein